MPERFSSADYFWRDYMNIPRDFGAKSEEEDIETEPLPEVSVYRLLLGKVDFLSFSLANHDVSCSLFWETFDKDIIGPVLKRESRGFLKLDDGKREGDVVKVTINSGEDENIDISVERQEKRVVFIFNNQETTVKGLFQTKNDTVWEDEQEIERKVVGEVDRLLDLVTGLKSLS